MGQPPASYFDTSTWDPRDVVSGGSRMVPIDTPSGRFRVWTKRVGTNPDLKVLLLHGGPGSSDELYECFDAWFPGRGHRVLLLRPTRLVPQRPARRPVVVGPRAVRRRGRAGPPSAPPRPQQLRAARAVVGRDPGDGVRRASPAAPEGPRDLEHDVEHTALQRLRDRRPHARDGPGRPRRDQALRGRGHDRRSTVRAAAHGASLRPARLPYPARGLARPGHARASPTSTRPSTCPCRGRASSA